MRLLKFAAVGLTAALALTACGQGSATKEAAAPAGKSVVRYMNLTWVANAHDGSVPGVVRCAAASLSVWVHLNTFCHGPENIAGSAFSAWLTSSSSARFGRALPGPGTVAPTVLTPRGRPVTTPSS